MDFLIVLVFGFALIWLFILMPQRRRQTTHNRMIDALSPGDYVVTAGGLYGTITEIGEDDLGLEVAPEVEVRVAKRAIGAVIPPEDIEEIEDEEDEPEAAAEAAAEAPEQPVEERPS